MAEDLERGALLAQACQFKNHPNRETTKKPGVDRILRHDRSSNGSYSTQIT